MIINRRAFTIIELLVVIGIISILAIALLVTLNPASGQQQTRDTKRMKDASTLQAIVEAYIFDGGDAICTSICDSDDGSITTDAETLPANTQQCSGTNWLDNADLCDYAQSIPADPINDPLTGTCAISDAATDPTCPLVYYFGMTGTNYEIGVRQESTTNADKLVNDPGSDATLFEIISNPQLTTEVIPVDSVPEETGT